MGIAAPPQVSDGFLVTVERFGEAREGVIVHIMEGEKIWRIGRTNEEGWIRTGPLEVGKWRLTASIGSETITIEAESLRGLETKVSLDKWENDVLNVCVNSRKGPVVNAWVQGSYENGSVFQSHTEQDGCTGLPPSDSTVEIKIEHESFPVQELKIDPRIEGFETEVFLSRVPLSPSLATTLHEIQRQGGLQVLVLFDYSSSMKPFVSGAKASVRDVMVVLETLVPGVEMGMRGFSRTMDSNFVPLVRLSDPSRFSQVLSYVSGLQASGGGDEPLDLALEWAGSPQRGWNEDAQKVVILFGDEPLKGGNWHDLRLSFEKGKGIRGGASISIHAMGKRKESARQFELLTSHYGGAYRDLPPDIASKYGTLALLRSIVGFSVGPEHQREIDALLVPENMDLFWEGH